MLLLVPSLQLIPLATSPHPYREMLLYITVRVSGSCCLAPSSTTCPLPPLEHRRHAELEAHPPPNPRAHGRTAPLPAQPSLAPGSPGAVSPVVRAELGAVCCVSAQESQIKGQRPRPKPGGRCWAPGAQPPPPDCSFPAWRYASSGCRRGHSPTHPGTSCGHSTV